MKRGLLNFLTIASAACLLFLFVMGLASFWRGSYVVLHRTPTSAYVLISRHGMVQLVKSEIQYLNPAGFGYGYTGGPGASESSRH